MAGDGGDKNMSDRARKNIKTPPKLDTAGGKEKVERRTVQSNGRININNEQWKHIGVGEGDEVLVISEGEELKIVANDPSNLDI